MPGKIPKTFIDNLTAQTDIVDIINQYISLKKKGGNYTACCPFHDEKTPSFSVNQTKQFYYCFGCGAHGDAISFVQNYNNLSFVEAVEELAHHLGTDVPYETTHTDQAVPQQNEYQQMYALLEKSAQFYQWHLRQTTGESAVKYCKQRGLSGTIAKTFGIGFVPAGWDHLNLFLNKDGKQTEHLLQTGMLSHNDQGRVYDRFRHRLMFPIRDRRGRVVGFGGRVIDSEEQPKYLNSPATLVFHKSKELYGLYEAQQANKSLDSLLVVEGYMDVVALAENGITNAVATMGTATSLGHLHTLFKITDKMVFSFDGDRAGKQAAWAALNTALPLMTGEHEVKFLFLPENEDPDTLINKEGADAFRKRIDTAQPLGEFLLAALAKGLDLNRTDGRAKYMATVLPYLAQMPSGSMQTVLLNTLSEQCQVPVTQIIHHLQSGANTIETPATTTQHASTFTTVEKAMHYLVSQPKLMQSITIPDWSDTENEDIALLLKMMQSILDHDPQNTGALIQQWPDATEAKKLAALAATSFGAHSTTASQQAIDVIPEFMGTIDRINQTLHTITLEKLLEKSKSHAVSDGEKQKIIHLLQKKQ